jgi:TolB-like protein
MPAEVKKEIALEIAHVLFIDIVGYSKLSVNDQHASVEELNQLVRASEEFRKAESAGRLLKIATGDGMALVFYRSPEEPARCAVEISRALKEHPHLQIRMGIHSGPISGVVDVNERANVAGAGINMAQRVMDCGDAGHILLSKRVAEDLEQDDRWRPLLHDLGLGEVKHGVRIGLANLYDSEIGNPQLPAKVQAVKKHSAYVRWAEAAIALLVLGTIVAAFIFVLRRPTRPALTVAKKSVAVLPFENRSEEKANSFFADGVQDEILTHLSRIADLKVISRTSVMQYKSGVARNLREIAQQLGVAHVVEGSVQRAGSKVRVNTQLIDATSDAHVWAQTYDRNLADVFAIQTEIAEEIAAQLQAKLSPREKAAIKQPPTTDLVAFDFYIRAKPIPQSHGFGARTKERLLEAVDLLNKAVARDPNFLSAYRILAYCHDQLYFLNLDRTADRLALADAAVQAALRLQPDSGEAHIARADYLYRAFLDYDGARAEIAIAQQALPNDPVVFELLGYIDRRQGRWEESARNLERAIELDPRNFFLLQQISLSYNSLRQYAKMAAALDRALQIVPDDPDTKVGRASVDLDWRADTRPIHDTIATIIAQDPAYAAELADQWVWLAFCERDVAALERALAELGNHRFGYDAVTFDAHFGAGLLARMRGDAGAAQDGFSRARAQQEEKVRAQPAYAPNLCVLALIDAGLGRKEEALRGGQRAIELLPVEKDQINGPHMIEFFAITCAWVGEKDLALKNLTIATQLPGSLSYGQLKLHPFWDLLRGDPRFERIVASLAPKDAASPTK